MALSQSARRLSHSASSSAIRFAAASASNSKFTSNLGSSSSSSSSSSSIQSSTSRSTWTTKRGYASAPTGSRNLATVVDDESSSSSKLRSLDTVKPYRPDPIILHPIKEGTVDEAVKSLREDIGRPIYLDMQATTPVDPRVLDAMLPYMTNQFGNPHSQTHAYGWESEKAVEEARQVCTFLTINLSLSCWRSVTSIQSDTKAEFF